MSIKIAILSDSHQKTKLTKDAIEMLKTKGVEYLIHAGDLELPQNLELLKNSGLSYVSVFGNNDYHLVEYASEYKIKQEPYYFKIQKYKFKLMHIPNYLTPDTDIVIFGHTHAFHCELKNNTLFINPGEVCARNKNLTECAYLEITEDKYKLSYNYKTPTATKWEEKIYEFNKNE
jgi:putative phosphoesterase